MCLNMINNNKNLLLCHHCNYQIEFKNECTSCKAKDSFITVGPGVEKIFEEVSSLFLTAESHSTKFVDSPG